MSKPIRKTSNFHPDWTPGQRFEHWLVDNQVYFITARCRKQSPALALDTAKAVFWERFDHYAGSFGFTPWVTSQLNNHYHTLRFLREGANLPKMMQRIHGSVAKLVNDLLPQRYPEFWGDHKGKEYFDGCIRDETQARRSYRYTLLQSVRHGICGSWQDYPHTRVRVEVEPAIRRSHELGAFLQGVPYKRYLLKRRGADA